MLSEPIKVLLVEDNRGDARLVKELLKDVSLSHIQLIHVERVSTALAHLANYKIDIVLLDLSLPDGLGLKPLRQIRIIGQGIPIIILTGLNSPEIAHKAMQHGASHYLVKGQFDSAMLERTISSYVGRTETI